MFYYEVKFANGESLVLLTDGDPVDEVPVEFQGDVIDVTTICEVTGVHASSARRQGLVGKVGV